MEAQDYLIAWVVYLVAAVVMLKIAWGVLRRYFFRELAYILQGLLIAVLFTPWYVLPDQEILAPAFIIFLMDSITISATAGIGALIPLIMAMLVTSLIAIIMGVVFRIRNRRRTRVDK